MLGLLAVAATVVYSVASAGASSGRARVGGVPPQPRSTRVLGATSQGRRLHLTIALQPQDPAALQSFATAVSTPGSAEYGKYLSVPEFAQRFGATPQHILAVRKALLSYGLTAGMPNANDLTLPVSGTVGDIENAFAVTESNAIVHGRSAFLNDQAPTLPADVSPYVQGVIGLDDLTPQHPQSIGHAGAVHTPLSSAARRKLSRAHAIGAGPAPCPEATADAQGTNHNGVGQQPEDGYTADEVASAYGINGYYPGDEGAGVSVALFEEGPTQASDVTNYESCYGIATPVNYVNVGQGAPAYQPGTDDDGEEALDIEMVAGIAPKVSSIDVYQDESNTAASDIISAWVSANKDKIMSSSWGACEALTDPTVINAENTLLQEAAAQGQSFFISSGDAGSTHCYQATYQNYAAGTTNFSLSVLDPAGQPFATGVGGTTMGTFTCTGESGCVTTPQNGSYPGETVWNDGMPEGFDQSSDPTRTAASGGGTSNQFPMPAYQSAAAGALDVVQSNSSRACASQLCRQVPDVAADADYFNSGYALYYDGGSPNGGWNVNAGTSAAAPLWAAITALMDASPACRGLSLGFMNPLLYSVAGGAYNVDFHDISQNTKIVDPTFGTLIGNDTFGGENSANPNKLYPVQAGYDMATGLGTPVVNALGPSMCAARAPVYTVAVASPGTVTAALNKPVSIAIHATDSGSAALGYSASGLPAGLVISPTTGVISGTPTVAGAATVTVAAGDAFTNAGSTQFAFNVVKPKIKKAAALKASKLTLAGLAKRKPKLTFTIGGGKTALKSFDVSVPKGLAFAKKAKSITKGVKIKAGKKAAKFTGKVKKGDLVITLKKTAKTVTVTIGKPALTITRSEAKKIKRKKVTKLALTIKTTDARKKTHTQKVTLKKLT